MKKSTNDNHAVSPVVGSLLMIVLVMLFMTTVGGFILSQYSTAPSTPDGTVKITQTTNSTLYETSDVTITAVAFYDADQINITTTNTSTLTNQSNGPYLAYKHPNGTTISPNDSIFTLNQIPLTNTSDTLYLKNAPKNYQFTLTAQNQNNQATITTYTVRYVN